MTDDQPARIRMAWIGSILAMLAGGGLGWFIDGRGVGFALGMLAGLGLFWLATGAATVRLQGEIMLYEGWVVRLAGAAAVALTGAMLFG